MSAASEMASTVPARLVESVLDLVGKTPLVAIRTDWPGVATDGRACDTGERHFSLEKHFDGA